jgi:hypothetical protein
VQHRNTRRIGIFALALIGFAGVVASQAAHAGTTLAATVSVDVHTDFLGDPGRTFTFTVTNTGTDAIGAVQILRPPQFTILGCPTAPAGWTAAKTPSGCTYQAGA